MFNQNTYIAQAWYKLPYAEAYTHIAQQGGELSHQFAEGEEGFVVAPFVASVQTPTYFIRPDVMEHYPIDALPTPSTAAPFTTDEAERQTDYARSFDICRDALCQGDVRKVVLSRRLCVQRYDGHDWDPQALFLEACRRYPDRYVAMWHTPLSGCWIVASPEILVERCATCWKTMALAGTMTWEAGRCEGKRAAWSGKDRKEQYLVQKYIYERLQQLAEQIEIVGPFPTRAADLAHLRSDISFTLHPQVGLRDVLQALHPTPAVCGLPTEKARGIIRRAEDSDRRYYAGYSGPLGLEGETRLYVSLRCMELMGARALLYAGGGLLPSSVEEHEWIETCRKLNTMLQLFES